MIKDYLLIGTDLDLKFAIRFLCLNEAIKTTIQSHQIGNNLNTLICEFILGSVILGSRADQQETTLFKLKFNNNPIMLNCEVSPRGEFRCAIFPWDKKDEYQNPPEGELRITRLNRDNQVYESILQIQKKGIINTFEHNLANSEQSDSILLINTDDNQKHYSLWINKLPDTSIEDWESFTKNFTPKFFTECLQKSADPDVITKSLFKNGIKILAVTKPKLFCNCNKERVITGLKALPNEELVELFMEAKGIETQCEYCRKVWKVSDNEIKALIKMSSSLH
ncbi:hypothetical protein BVY03_04680 [bacterium K02(2017)]|nr:hypothetical protein BVY03_04680 [bacterium K02(2017)]